MSKSKKSSQKSQTDDLIGAVLVIGGGIAGIQASLDLTEMGFKVFLVEKTPSIGGRMAQLDKTFPTNDCSLCILAPKMVEIFRNPNIELMTYSEVIEVSGHVGHFYIKILKKPRYVDENKCTGCGDCASKCPKIEAPNIFDMNLGKRKSIYIPFPQAVPPVYLIDSDMCLFLNKGVCKVCERICEAQAINFEQKPEEVQIEVGAIIVAIGFDMLASKLPDNWGYKYENVITSLEYERILCASGPFEGHVLRLSDEKEPQKIAFIQCAGSRDFHIGIPYCSSVCCMYIAKEAIITKEHSNSSECYIFRHDLRAYGKNFYEYTQRAQDEYGVKYFNSKISKIVEDPETKDLIIHYEDLNDGKFNDLRANLVILATPLVPSEDSEKVAKILGINIDKYKFFKEKTLYDKLSSEREGIFLCGFCQGPLDIPETVADASGVANKVSTLLYPVRNTLLKEKVVSVPEKKINLEDEPCIGVMICHCGINIGKYVDVPQVVEYIKTLPNVNITVDNLYSCSSDSQTSIKELIAEYDLNRFIVASCTPRTHEKLFQETCEEAGLNKYLFEMVNIRDQCSWVHMEQKVDGTKKAKDLIEMAVAKSRLLKPQKESKLPITSEALIIGGGISGLIATLNIAKQGFTTHLVEKESQLGGNLNNLYQIFPGYQKASEFLEPFVNKVKSHSNINIYLNSNITEIRGYIGNYDVIITTKGNKVNNIKVGTIIVATGSKELIPETIYNYKKEKNVITQLELEQKLRKENIEWLDNIKSITFILCVNSRQKKGITYCSNICCTNALKNINILKKLKPDLALILIYRDLQMSKKGNEEFYRDSRKNALFLRYSLDKLPIISKTQNRKFNYKITLFEHNLKGDVEFYSDLIILATPMIAPENFKELSKMLKVPQDQSGFFLEAHVKLRPIDFATDGVFLCGCAHWPKNIQESIAQANGAAGRAIRILGAKEMKTSGLVAEVIEDYCIGCGKCADVCPYNAIELIEVEKTFEDYTLRLKKSNVNSALCKGCGTCGVQCPNSAIIIKHFSFKQINAMIEAYLKN